jgi:hypothetical protein
VVGSAEGLPDVTVGPEVLGIPVVGTFVGSVVADVGDFDGGPVAGAGEVGGIVFGLADVGAVVVGVADVGVADGVPAVTVGAGVGDIDGVLVVGDDVSWTVGTFD